MYILYTVDVHYPRSINVCTMYIIVCTYLACRKCTLNVHIERTFKGYHQTQFWHSVNVHPIRSFNVHYARVYCRLRYTLRACSGNCVDAVHFDVTTVQLHSIIVLYAMEISSICTTFPLTMLFTCSSVLEVWYKCMLKTARRIVSLTQGRTKNCRKYAREKKRLPQSIYLFIYLFLLCIYSSIYTLSTF